MPKKATTQNRVNAQILELPDAVDDLLNERLLDQDGRPYSRDQIERALGAWLGRLNEALLGDLAQHAQNGFQFPALELPPCSDLDLAEEARDERADIAYERYREHVAA